MRRLARISPSGRAAPFTVVFSPTLVNSLKGDPTMRSLSWFSVAFVVVVLLGIALGPDVAGASVVPDILEFRMDKASWSGTAYDVIDSTAHGHNGKASGGANTVDESSLGKLGRSGSFDGSNDYVHTGNSTALAPENSITLESWVKLDSLYVSGVSGEEWKYNRCIIGRNDYSYVLEIEYSGSLQFYLPGGAGGWLNADLGVVDMNDYIDQWVHIVATYDNGTGGGNREKLIYFNGNEVARQENLTGTITQANTYTRVGYIGNNRYFDGLIDQVGIYSSALSPEEVLYRYSLGIPEPSSVLLLALGGLGLLPWRRRRSR